MGVEYHQAKSQLEQEQGAQYPGVGGGEAVVLSQGAATAAHRDQEDEEAGQDEEDGDGDEPVVQEVQILSVGQLGHNPRQDQDEAKDLKIFP